MEPLSLINKDDWQKFAAGNDPGSIFTYLQTTQDIIGYIEKNIAIKSAEELQQALTDFLAERKVFIEYALKNCP